MIGVKQHLDKVTVPRQGLIHRVIDDLPQTMHQALLIGGADVHRGAFAHRLQAFQNREMVSRVSRSVIRHPDILPIIRFFAVLPLRGVPIFSPVEDGWAVFHRGAVSGWEGA